MVSSVASVLLMKVLVVFQLSGCREGSWKRVVHHGFDWKCAFVSSGTWPRGKRFFRGILFDLTSCEMDGRHFVVDGLKFDLGSDPSRWKYLRKLPALVVLIF